jgi:hypothetical protein
MLDLHERMRVILEQDWPTWWAARGRLEAGGELIVRVARRALARFVGVEDIERRLQRCTDTIGRDALGGRRHSCTTWRGATSAHCISIIVRHVAVIAIIWLVPREDGVAAVLALGDGADDIIAATAAVGIGARIATSPPPAPAAAAPNGSPPMAPAAAPGGGAAGGGVSVGARHSIMSNTHSVSLPENRRGASRRRY